MTTLPLSASAKIASYQLLPPNGLAIEKAQATHRIKIINSWSAIRPDCKVLELGCGQGNSTAVLAEAVGPTGHVDAVDPASPDYGAPFTLAEAQSHITQSEIGDRVAWHRATPQDFLAGESGKSWDVAVLTHCIWYFQTPSTIVEILRALKHRVKRVCIAEYAVKATEKNALPHVLAAISRGMLEAHNSESSQNIRTLVGPGEIVQIAKAEGWSLDSETCIVPREGLLDGSWEVGTVVSDGFLQEVEQKIDDDRVKCVLKSARGSVLAAVENVGGVGKVQTMDVWTGVFSLSS